MDNPNFLLMACIGISLLLLIVMIAMKTSRFYFLLIFSIGGTAVFLFLIRGSGPKKISPDNMRRKIRQFKVKWNISEKDTPKIFTEKEMLKWKS